MEFISGVSVIGQALCDKPLINVIMFQVTAKVLEKLVPPVLVTTRRLAAARKIYLIMAVKLFPAWLRNRFKIIAGLEKVLNHMKNKFIATFTIFH